MRQLEDDLGHSPQRWKQRLDVLEHKFTMHRQRNVSAVKEAQSVSMTAHKKTTIDILVRVSTSGLY